MLMKMEKQSDDKDIHLKHSYGKEKLNIHLKLML